MKTEKTCCEVSPSVESAACTAAAVASSCNWRSRLAVAPSNGSMVPYFICWKNSSAPDPGDNKMIQNVKVESLQTLIDGWIKWNLLVRCLNRVKSTAKPLQPRHPWENTMQQPPPSPHRESVSSCPVERGNFHAWNQGFIPKNVEFNIMCIHIYIFINIYHIIICMYVYKYIYIYIHHISIFI